MVLVAGEGMSGPTRGTDLLAASPSSDRVAMESAVRAPAVGWRHCAELGVVMVAALALAIGAPLTTAVYALILFGVLHNYFEIRYLIGRFGGLLRGRLAEWVLIVLSLVVLARGLPLGALGRPAEIVAGYLLMAGVLTVRLRGRPMLLGCGLALLVVAATVSLTFPDHHFVVVTHLHNVLPLAFIWEWSRRQERGRPSTLFLGLTLVWAFALPVLLFSGIGGIL